MAYEELLALLQHVGKDPSRLIFEDELTGIHNRRFLHHYFEHKVVWAEVALQPLSLLMMDVDAFKEINDRHGHDAGDEALIWVTRVLREVGGAHGLPIRYAGDEFVLLLPETAKSEAMQVGGRLLERLREEPCRLSDGQTVSITLSIGVATAPEDGESGKLLLQKADTALYYVKKSGRNGLANASELELQEVYAKTALHQLEASNIAGRGLQLIEVAEAFKKFSRGQSQFVMIRGESGMGKTTFLETIRRNLAQSDMPIAKVTASRHEVSHPYLLATHLIATLLGLRPDKGAGVLKALPPADIQSLGHLLPHLTPDGQAGGDQKADREALCSTLVHLIPKIVEQRPTILLIDDLQFADEATLLVFRLLHETQALALFLCGAAVDPASLRVDDRPVPLARFLEELPVKIVDLSPLNAADIAVHLKNIFPQLALPDHVALELERVSRGNPQFLAELIRKLVLDQKVALVGQRWVIEPFEPGYLPRSLDEIVKQKIARLDAHSQQLLAQVSTFGEHLSLSYLAGSSHAGEAQILDFLDTAVAQGLLTSDFRLDDEAIRFPGKGIQTASYNEIPDGQRESLHRQIAEYQERLFKKGLLPSASPLVYHFTRSNDPEKAGTYELIQAEHDQQVFNAEEAQDYSGEVPDEPLDSPGRSRIPTVLRLFLTAVRSIKLYPPESRAIVTVMQQLREALNDLLVQRPRLTFAHKKGVLHVNSERLEVTDFKPIADSFVETLGRLELESLAFQSGYDDHELKLVVEGLGRVERKMIDHRFWQRFVREQGLRRIQLKQVRYKEREPAQPVERPAREEKLERDDLPIVQELLRALLTAARNVRLYPPTSRTVTHAIEQLNTALREALVKRPVLTLARLGRGLMVNGDKIDTSGFQAQAAGFLDFLQSIGLTSLTFVAPVAEQDTQTFLTAVADPAATFTPDSWQRLAQERGLAGLRFDQRLYEVRDLTAGAPAPAPEAPPQPAVDPAEITPTRLIELLTAGEHEQVSLVLASQFEGYSARDLAARRVRVELCRATLEQLPLAFQPAFAHLVTDALLQAFAAEPDTKLFSDLVGALHRAAATLIRSGDYLLAIRLLSQLQQRQRQLHEVKDPRASIVLKALGEKLEPATWQLLGEDLRSGDGERQQRATQVVTSVGRAAAPFLIEFIKQTEELRPRHLAASLLKEHGADAIALFKRELVLEITAHERLRLIEVADSVSRDLQAEFGYLLEDAHLPVQDAAFRLAERLNDKKLIELLVEYSRQAEPELAAGAIKCLGRLKAPGATALMLALIKTATDPVRLVACCRALAQLADPASIDGLAALLSRGSRWFGFRRAYAPLVRATAAFALAQIAHPQATKVLTAHVNDRDPRVRKIARTRVQRSETPRKAGSL